MVSQEEIIDIVVQLCPLLPGTLKLECTEFITAFGPTIISILASDIEPWVLCGKIGLCTNTTTQVLDMLLFNHDSFTPSNSSTYFVSCSIIFGFFKKKKKLGYRLGAFNLFLEQMYLFLNGASNLILKIYFRLTSQFVIHTWDRQTFDKKLLY